MKDENKIEEYVSRIFPQFEPGLKEELIKKGSLKRFSAGEILMQTGQYFRSTMLIVEGRVKLFREGDQGEEIFIYYIEPGGACALSMICSARQESSEISAKAVEDTVALLVPIQLMDELMQSFRSWYYFVLDTYRSRYEELLLVIDNIAFKSMDTRLESYLKHQYEKIATRHLNLTHQEIANDLNSSREVISRLLKKMEQRGDVILHRNYIEWVR